MTHSTPGVLCRARWVSRRGASPAPSPSGAQRQEYLPAWGVSPCVGLRRVPTSPCAAQARVPSVCETLPPIRAATFAWEGVVFPLGVSVDRGGVTSSALGFCCQPTAERSVLPRGHRGLTAVSPPRGPHSTFTDECTLLNSAVDSSVSRNCCIKGWAEGVGPQPQVQGQPWTVEELGCLRVQRLVASIIRHL